MRVVRLLTAIAVFTVANCEGEPPIEDESCGVKTNADTERQVGTRIDAMLIRIYIHIFVCVHIQNWMDFCDDFRTKKIVFYSIGDWGIHHWCDYNPASKHKGLGCKGEEQLKTARSMVRIYPGSI